jgi:hypothetical protein
MVERKPDATPRHATEASDQVGEVGESVGFASDLASPPDVKRELDSAQSQLTSDNLLCSAPSRAWTFMRAEPT